MEPDFRVAGLFLVAGCALDVIPYVQLTLGPLVTLLGAVILLQTFRIRFRFTADNCFELVTTTDEKTQDGQEEYGSSGENLVVGGENRWRCDKIVNYDFFPSIDDDEGGSFSRITGGQPILVYFKEQQTPSEKWNEGPGERANDPEKIAAGTGACVYSCACARV